MINIVSKATTKIFNAVLSVIGSDTYDPDSQTSSNVTPDDPPEPAQLAANTVNQVVTKREPNNDTSFTPSKRPHVILETMSNKTTSPHQLENKDSLSKTVAGNPIHALSVDRKPLLEIKEISSSLLKSPTHNNNNIKTNAPQVAEFKEFQAKSRIKHKKGAGSDLPVYATYRDIQNKPFFQSYQVEIQPKRHKHRKKKHSPIPTPDGSSEKKPLSSNDLLQKAFFTSYQKPSPEQEISIETKPEIPAPDKFTPQKPIVDKVTPKKPIVDKLTPRKTIPEVNNNKPLKAPKTMDDILKTPSKSTPTQNLILKRIEKNVASPEVAIQTDNSHYTPKNKQPSSKDPNPGPEEVVELDKRSLEVPQVKEKPLRRSRRNQDFALKRNLQKAMLSREEAFKYIRIDPSDEENTEEEDNSEQDVNKPNSNKQNDIEEEPADVIVIEEEDQIEIGSDDDDIHDLYSGQFELEGIDKLVNIERLRKQQEINQGETLDNDDRSDHKSIDATFAKERALLQQKKQSQQQRQQALRQIKLPINQIIKKKLFEESTINSLTARNRDDIDNDDTSYSDLGSTESEVDDVKIRIIN